MDTASTSNTSGTLYIVATPIGNLSDITRRAIAILESVDGILAEDTRHSQPLLTALGIHKPLLSLHTHNEKDKSPQIIAALLKGKSYALISDAGTPLISDPGFVLVREVKRAAIAVVPIPGPCALITALCAAGVPCDSFLFAGFLPVKDGARKTKLRSLKASSVTSIVYESTHRLMECLDDIISIYGDTYIFVLAKELTKTFEHIMQANGAEIKNWLLADEARQKGEFVIILPGVEKVLDNAEDERLLTVLLEALPLKQAVTVASELSSSAKNELYSLALRLKA